MQNTPKCFIKSCWNFYLACKQQQLYGPVNYRNLEKRAPGPKWLERNSNHKTVLLFTRTFFFYLNRSLAYFLKRHAAYRKLFPLFVWIFNPHKIIQKCCLWGQQEAKRKRANLKQWIPAHTPTHGLGSASCLSIAISLYGRENKAKKKAFNVIGGMFVLKLYLLEVK